MTSSSATRIYLTGLALCLFFTPALTEENDYRLVLDGETTKHGFFFCSDEADAVGFSARVSQIRMASPSLEEASDRTYAWLKYNPATFSSCGYANSTYSVVRAPLRVVEPGEYGERGPAHVFVLANIELPGTGPEQVFALSLEGDVVRRIKAPVPIPRPKR